MGYNFPQSFYRFSGLPVLLPAFWFPNLFNNSLLVALVALASPLASCSLLVRLLVALYHLDGWTAGQTADRHLWIIRGKDREREKNSLSLSN